MSSIVGLKCDICFFECRSIANVDSRKAVGVCWQFNVGEIPYENQVALGLEHYLPEITNPIYPEVTVEQEVLSLLELGRTVNSEYDVKNSPIATFMAKTVGFDEMRKLLALSRQFFKGDITSEKLIEGFPKALADSITESIGKLFDNRKSVLLGNV